MNSCVLMAEIVQEPELRYTPDQTALTEMLVQFPGLRAEDSPATLKVVGWGNLAQEIQQSYHQGDRVIIEGRLTMSTVERPEGFKEKRAELTIQRIHSLSDGVSISSSAFASAPNSSNANASLNSMEAPNSGTAMRNANSSEMSGSSRNPAAAKASTGGAVTNFAPDDDVSVPQSVKPQSSTSPGLPSEQQDIDDIPF